MKSLVIQNLAKGAWPIDGRWVFPGQTDPTTGWVNDLSRVGVWVFEGLTVAGDYLMGHARGVICLAAVKATPRPAEAMAGRPPYGGPVSSTVEIYMPIPVSKPTWWRENAVYGEIIDSQFGQQLALEGAL